MPRSSGAILSSASKMSGAYGFPARECLCFARRLPRAEEVLEGQARPSPPSPSKQNINQYQCANSAKWIAVSSVSRNIRNYMELYGIIRPKIFETKDRCVWKLLVNKKTLSILPCRNGNLMKFAIKFAFVSSECSDKEVEPAKSPTRVNILQQWSP